MTNPRGGLRLSTRGEEMDVDAVHAYLSGESYWARGIPRKTVARAIQHSLCVGVFCGAAQVAFARAVTDRATYAYLADVYVLEPYRGRGLGRWMLEALTGHPELQGLRWWMLMTHDAHGLYARFGFTPLAHPERAMERTDPGVYARTPGRRDRRRALAAAPRGPTCESSTFPAMVWRTGLQRTGAAARGRALFRRAQLVVLIDVGRAARMARRVNGLGVWARDRAVDDARRRGLSAAVAAR